MKKSSAMTSLRDATQTKHKEAEQMPFNARMFEGRLSENEYLLYLIQQLDIFQTIENKTIPHNDLARVPYVQLDIDELRLKGNTAKEILPKTKEYTTYLESLSDEEILPHVYLNYLALMFGGQIMKKKVPSQGKMYDFENQKEAMMAIRAVQKDEWADEVNQAYDYIKHIFANLEEVIVSQSEIL